MGSVLLVALDTDTVAFGAAGAQLGPVVRTKDQRIVTRVGQVLSERSLLVHIVPNGRYTVNTCMNPRLQWETYTRPWVGSEIAI